MSTLNISKFYTISKENDGCGIVEKIEETSNASNGKEVVKNTEDQVKESVEGKELEGNEPNINQIVEFDTNGTEEPKLPNGLEGGEQVLEEVSAEADRLTKELDNIVNVSNKLHKVSVECDKSIKANTELLKDPAKVVPADVRVATESLKYKLWYLDIPEKNSKALCTISSESIEANPARDLMICLEDEQTLAAKIKEKASKILEWIMKVFRKVMNFVKSKSPYNKKAVESYISVAKKNEEIADKLIKMELDPNTCYIQLAREHNALEEYDAAISYYRTEYNNVITEFLKGDSAIEDIHYTDSFINVINKSDELTRKFLNKLGLNSEVKKYPSGKVAIVLDSPGQAALYKRITSDDGRNGWMIDGGNIFDPTIIERVPRKTVTVIKQLEILGKQQEKQRKDLDEILDITEKALNDVSGNLEKSAKNMDTDSLRNAINSGLEEESKKLESLKYELVNMNKSIVDNRKGLDIDYVNTMKAVKKEIDGSTEATESK